MAMKTMNLKYFGVMILIFRGHVMSSKRDHRTRQRHFPTDSQWWPRIYVAWIRRYRASKILGSRVWPFGVTSLTFWGHVTSLVTWPLDSAYVVSYWWSIGTMHLPCTVTEILGPKDIEITTLIFWGHVTSSITWPSDLAWARSYWWSMITYVVSYRSLSSVTWSLDSAYLVSYWWSIGTMHLSCTITET